MTVKKATQEQGSLQKKSHRFWPRFGASIGVIASGVAAWLGGQLLAGIVSRQLGIVEQTDNISSTFVIYLFSQIVILALLAGFAYFAKAKHSELGLGGIKNWNVVLLLPLIYIVTLILSAVASIIIALFVPGFDADQTQNLGLPSVGHGDLLVTGLFLVIAVPLIEEFIFRGYLFGMLRRYLPLWLTTLLVSVIFGAAHGQWNVAINVFILSVALCYMREKTGSIWAGVGLHALKNFIAYLLLFVYNIV